MRGTRWLLLVVIAAILGGIGITYRAQKKVLQEQAPAKPKPLAAELSSSSERYEHHVTDQGRPIADIYGDDVRQIKDSSRVDLRNVLLKLYNRDGESYNLAKSAAAAFFPSDQRLYSEGEVEMTLKVPLQGQPTRTPVSIKSSGVTLDSRTGHAETDRPASFVFENGEGTAVGAYYDPANRQLLMKSNVVVHWKAKGPRAKPMTIEGASLDYHEADSEIWLKPWGKLTRENTVVEGENVVIHLADGAIRKIDAIKAHGTDSYPNRKLQYSAGALWIEFDEGGEIEKIIADTSARLVSTSDTAETSVTAKHVEMAFASGDNQSTLTAVSALGDSVVTTKPIPAKGRQPGETHVLRSDIIDLAMRPGGREIETVTTRAPGRIEFIPNLPAQHHRTLDGKDIRIAYGAQNRIESFRAREARTVTDPTEAERKRNRKPAVTTSRELLAHFDPKTSRMSALEQWGDFAYEEGDRRARAAKATLDSEQNMIVLETAARFWDSTGATSADAIHMDQRTGDFTAEGNVRSSRLPEKDQKKNSQMLSGDEPLEAQARRMSSKNRNRALHYEGNALMWQGANRIRGDVIDLDRERRNLTANGNVVTELWETPKDEPKKKGAAPVLTVVHAQRLVYTEENRVAVYTGGVLLTRPGMEVKSRELRAFLAESGGDSRLDKAFADGTVRVVQTAKEKTRTGTGEHCEYYTGEQKVILKGGWPRLVETPGSTTEGNELTYFANDDRLLVNGAPQKRGRSEIIRKH
jgi:lipopolysaccharide export system protein LptA